MADSVSLCALLLALSGDLNLTAAAAGLITRAEARFAMLGWAVYEAAVLVDSESSCNEQ